MSGTLLRFDPAGQMTQFEPVYSHIALWRVDDAAAVADSWRESAKEPRLAGLKRRVSFFDVMQPYLTRDDVANCSAEDLAIEEAARQRTERSNAAAQGEKR